jgi:hypothetical protein
MDEVNDDDEDTKVVNPPQSNTISIFDKDFNLSKKLQNRICVTTAGCVRPDALLWQELLRLGEDSKLIHIGTDRALRNNPNQKPFDDMPAIFVRTLVKAQAMIIEEKKE